MRKQRRLATCFATLAVIGIISLPTFAAENVYVYLPINQVWSDRNETQDSRTGNYNTVSARCHSVYPDTGTDNYSHIQVRVVNAYGTLISNDPYLVLNEGSASPSYLSIKEGYLGLTQVYFQFRGNTNASANAIVSYSGR
jgi:hypothetical protein